MFGGRWWPASAITPYMCAIAPALYCQVLISIALFAAGRSDRLLQWALIEAAVTVAFGLAGARFGLVGLAIAGTARLYLMAPLAWVWLKQDVGVHPAAMLWPAAPCIAASLLMAGIVYLARTQALEGMARGPLLAASVAIGVLVYGLMLPFTATVVWRRLFDRSTVKAAPSASAAAAEAAP
jgi:O-antigen/teichoic acid export membrane protein